jgi:hypothetical protein
VLADDPAIQLAVGLHEVGERLRAFRARGQGQVDELALDVRRVQGLD